MKIYKKTRKEYKQDASRGKCWRYYCMIEGEKIDTCDIDITTLVLIGYYNPNIKLRKYVCEEQKIHSYEELYIVMSSIRPESEKSTDLLEKVIVNLNGGDYLERVKHLTRLQERSSRKILTWGERHSARLDILKKLSSNLTSYTLPPEPMHATHTFASKQTTTTPIRTFTERTK